MTTLRIPPLPTRAPSANGYVYVLLSLLLPIAMIVNNKAAVPLAVAGALAVLVIGWRQNALREFRRFDGWLLAGVAAYLCAATIASLFSGYISESLVSVTKFLGTMVVAVVLIIFGRRLSGPDASWAATALIVSVVITSAWLLTDSVFDGVLSRLQYGFTETPEQLRVRLDIYGYYWYKAAASVLVVAAIVAGIALQRFGRPGVIAALALAIAAMFAALGTGSRTAGYGMVVALVAGVIFQILGRHRIRITVAALAMLFLLPVAITATGFSPKDISENLSRQYGSAYSVVYRAYVWQFTAEKIMQRPLLGWGAGASKRVGTDEAGVISDPKFGDLGEPIPSHPHNGILQIWLEFGIAGAIAAFIILSRGLVLLDRQATSPGTRTWAFAGVTLLACFFGFSFSVSSSWWLASVIICIALASAFLRSSGGRAES